jgi:predicted transcriptional regulator
VLHLFAASCIIRFMAIKRITVNLKEKVARKLERIARFHRRSTTAEAELAIEAHLQKLNPEPCAK